jgi:hypothetical protein
MGAASSKAWEEVRPTQPGIDLASMPFSSEGFSEADKSSGGKTAFRHLNLGGPGHEGY